MIHAMAILDVIVYLFLLTWYCYAWNDDLSWFVQRNNCFRSTVAVTTKTVSVVSCLLVWAVAVLLAMSVCRMPVPRLRQSHRPITTSIVLYSHLMITDLPFIHTCWYGFLQHTYKISHILFFLTRQRGNETIIKMCWAYFIKWLTCSLDARENVKRHAMVTWTTKLIAKLIIENNFIKWAHSSN